jgi:PPE-repeat protein
MKIVPIIFAAVLLCAATVLSQTSGTGGSGTTITVPPGVRVVFFGSGTPDNMGSSAGIGGIQTGSGGAPANQVRSEVRQEILRTNQFLSTNALFGTNGLPPTMTDGPPTCLFGSPR